MVWSTLANSIRLRLRDQAERMRERSTGFPVDSVLARMRELAGPANMSARELQQAHEEMWQVELELSPGG